MSIKDRLRDVLHESHGAQERARTDFAQRRAEAERRAIAEASTTLCLWINSSEKVIATFIRGGSASARIVAIRPEYDGGRLFRLSAVPSRQGVVGELLDAHVDVPGAKPVDYAAISTAFHNPHVAMKLAEVAREGIKVSFGYEPIRKHTLLLFDYRAV